MTTYPSLEEILERQSLKLRDLEIATELIKSNTNKRTPPDSPIGTKLCGFLESYTRKCRIAYLTLRLVFITLKGDSARKKHTVVLGLSHSKNPQTSVSIDKFEMKEELVQLRTEVSSISDGVGAMRTWLHKTKDQNNRCRELLSSIKLLDDRIIHMDNNVPQELIHDYQSKTNISNNSLKTEPVKNSGTSIETNSVTPDSPMKDCKKILFSEPEVYPVMPLITTDEFSKIPKYIIGRQTLATVNNLLDSINQILKAKYTFLSLGKAHARKQGDLNLYLHYKKQDLDICTTNEYVYFFTGEDYEKHTNSKLNKIKLNLLVVLRHCKRLREHRVKNDIRYIVQK